MNSSMKAMLRKAMLVRAMLLALMTVAGPVFSYAQTANQKSGSGTATAPPGFQVYSNSAVHLTYTYPAALTPIDGAFAAAATQRMIYGEDATTNQRADRCVKVLLSVGSGREGKGTWVRLGVTEVNGQCFPAKVLQKKKATQALLVNMVRQGTTLMGMATPGEPAGYLIEGHWASFGGAEGQPVSNSDVQTAEQQILGLVAVQAEGGFLIWVIETNDASAFNSLLGSGVDFGAGKPEELFAGRTQ